MFFFFQCHGSSDKSLGPIDPQTYYIPRMTVPPPNDTGIYNHASCVGLIAGISKNGVPIFNAWGIHSYPM